MKIIKKHLIKIITALMISLFAGGTVTSISLVSDVHEAEAASYPGDFRYWSQGQSDHSGIINAGCWVVAQAKLLYETGVDRSASFNPDRYAEWEVNNGLMPNLTTNVRQLNGGEAPSIYAQQKGKTLEYLGYWKADADQLWYNINAGYYTIVKVNGGSHYVYLDNEKSKATGQLYCDESSTDNYWKGPRLLSSYGTWSGGYVYKAAAQPVYDPWNNELKGKEVFLEPGYYIINSATGDRFLDNAGNTTNIGANMYLWESVGHGGQIFYVGRRADGACYLQNLTSDLFVSTEVFAAGHTNAVMWSGNGNDGQNFRLFDAGNGYVYISNLYKYFLDVDNGLNEQGRNVQFFSFNGSTAQKWKFVKVSGKEQTVISDYVGDYLIYSKSNPTKYLSVASDKTDNGSNIQLNRAFIPKELQNYFQSSIIQIPGDFKKTTPQGIIFTVGKHYNTWIRNKAADKYVNTVNNTNGRGYNVDIWEGNGAYGQNWYLEDAGDGYYYLRSRWGYYLDVDIANGENVIVWDFTGNDDQKWKFIKYDTVTGVNLNTTNMTLTEGKSGILTATIAPSNANNKNLSWSSSNTSVATVDDKGIVTGIKTGTAVITAKAEDNGTIATCTVTVEDKPLQNTGKFSDVYKDDWYYKAVEWAAAKGIATGSNGKFYPASTCTREQAITFIWRMQGMPNPKSTKSKYSDVKNKNRYSYKAIMWGTEKGIITGKNGKFYPKKDCTREQIITMLWRLTGSPNPRNMNSKFSDVKNTKSYSYKAILWANQNGITTGGSGKFYPTAKCKRCDIVTFIYRYKN